MRPLAWLVPIGGFALAVAVQSAAVHIDIDRPNDPLYLPDARVARHLDLGLGEAWADWLHIQALLYVVEEFDDRQAAVDAAQTEVERQAAKRAAKYVWLAQLYDAITELDPKFKDAYLYGARFLTLLSKEEDAAIALLEKGVAANPGSYELMEELGMIYYIDKKDTEQALVWLRRAIANPNAHPMLVGFTSRISEGTNHDVEVLRALDQQIAFYAAKGDAPMEAALRDKKREHFARIALIRLTRMRDAALGRGVDRADLTIEDLQQACIAEQGLPQGFFAEAGGFWYDRATGDVESMALAPSETDRRTRRLGVLLAAYRTAHQGRWPADRAEFEAWSTAEGVPHHPLPGWRFTWDPATGEVREEGP